MRDSGARTVGETLRAVADTVVPSSPHDLTPGAASIDAERFIEHYLEFLTTGLSRTAAALLDERALDSGHPFAALSHKQRAEIIHAMCDDPHTEQLGQVLVSLSIAAVYGEWSGIDADGSFSGPPLGWELTGFIGPRSGVPSLMRET